MFKKVVTSLRLLSQIQKGRSFRSLSQRSGLECSTLPVSQTPGNAGFYSYGIVFYHSKSNKAERNIFFGSLTLTPINKFGFFRGVGDEHGEESKFIWDVYKRKLPLFDGVSQYMCGLKLNRYAPVGFPFFEGAEKKRIIG